MIFAVSAIARIKFPTTCGRFAITERLVTKRRGSIRNLQIGTIDHVVIAARDRKRIGGRSQIGDFKRPAHQRRKGLRITAGLHKRNIAIRIHVEFAQRLNVK